MTTTLDRRRLIRRRHLRVGVHRDMGTDDHELIRVLTFLEFILEPLEAFFVESACCTAGLVGIVENDDLDRDISPRIEVIAGKSFFDHLRRESVTDRLRRGVSEFLIHSLIESERRCGSAATFGGFGKFP